MRVNKRGASLSGWSEAAIFITLFMVLAGIVIVNMNATYDKNYDGTFGIGTESTKQDFIDYQQQLQTGVKSGETTGSGLGLSLTTVWSMIQAGIGITWTFLSGQWIPNSISLLNLGEGAVQLGQFLQILYALSVGFIAVKLFMRIKP